MISWPSFRRPFRSGRRPGLRNGRADPRAFRSAPSEAPRRSRSSKQMLEKSAKAATPGLRFELGDIGVFQPEGPLDLVFSNAALHWLPEHEKLFPKIWAGPNPAVRLPSRCRTTSTIPRTWSRPGSRAGFFRSFFRDDVRLGHTHGGTLRRPAFQERSRRADLPRRGLRASDGVRSRGRRVDEGSLLTAYQERLATGDFERSSRPIAAS